MKSRFWFRFPTRLLLALLLAAPLGIICAYSVPHTRRYGGVPCLDRRKLRAPLRPLYAAILPAFTADGGGRHRSLLLLGFPLAPVHLPRPEKWRGCISSRHSRRSG